MTPDDLFDDTLGDDEDLMADADFYPDSDAYYLDDEDGYEDLLDEDEADYGSSSKRREKTRRTALRRDTPKVKAWARRGMAAERRRIDKRSLANQARRHWRRKVQPKLPGPWDNTMPLPLPPGFIRVLGDLYVQTAISLVTQKLADATSPMDVVYLSGRAVLATAIMRSKLMRGQITTAQAQAYAESVFSQLEPAEQMLKFLVEKAGSGEAEPWDGEDEIDAFEALYEDEGFGEQMAHRAASPSQRVRCARALRQGARYLLRLERQLAAGGR